MTNQMFSLSGVGWGRKYSFLSVENLQSLVGVGGGFVQTRTPQKSQMRENYLKMKFKGKYLGFSPKYLLTILLVRKSPERAFLAARKACTKICLERNDVTDPLYFFN